MNNEMIIEEFISIYRQGKSGRPTFGNQGQSMDGYSQLACYNYLAEKAEKFREKGSLTNDLSVGQ